MTPHTNIEDYILSIADKEDPLLYELNRLTHVRIMHPRMLTGHLQGQFLRMISYMIRPKRILELGTFTGYSAICLASGLTDDGHLTTIEINDEITDIAREYFKKAGLEHKITLHVGDALEIISTLKDNYDLVFIDAEKSQYLAYYKLIFDKVVPGGFILADNVLWSGKVMDEPRSGDHFTNGIIEFNEFVKTDPRVEKTILPMRDGLMLLRKK